MQDGPIDIIAGAFGDEAAIVRAYNAGCLRFCDILDELCSELEELRRPANPQRTKLSGPVAHRMFEAVSPFAAQHFITPMAAVAGSVAEEVLAAMVAAGGEGLQRAYVNNGGDIALHLTEGTNFAVGLVDRPDRPSLFGSTTIHHSSGIAGVATSGAGGRSFSLGIADAVTVLARTASQADAAATIIANAVDLPGHPGIVRIPAQSLQPDSDLGDLAVTRSVPPLAADEIDYALDGGVKAANACIGKGLIHGAALHLQGVTRVAGLPAYTGLAGLRPAQEKALSIGRPHSHFEP
jgi:ApbE superfamily uncharacterized protein (UPF0280 family)